MKSEITARFALCQRCTNCSPHSNNRFYDRLDRVQPDSYQTLDHFATYRLFEQRMSGYKCGSRQWISRIHLTQQATSLYGKRSKNALLNHNTSASCGRFSLIRKGHILTHKESDIFEIKRRTKQGDPLSRLLFNIDFQMALKDDVARWQKQKGMGICSGDAESDSFTNFRFAVDVLFFLHRRCSFKKCCVTATRVPERVGLKINPDRTKILSNQS